MVGLLYDCLGNPLGAVRLTFEKALASSSADPSKFDGKDWGVVDLFRDFLYDQASLSQVPILNSNSLRWIQPNTLVRFRGMIQDMLGNEIYVGAYKDGSIWRTNKYADVSQSPICSSSEMRFWERRILYCVPVSFPPSFPVPGRGSWIESSSEAAAANQNRIGASQQREKRPREDEMTIDDMSLPRENGHASQSSQPRNVTEGSFPSFDAVPCSDSHISCLVKIYDTPESELKLNDVFEFVGVLTFDQESTVDNDCSDELSGSSEDMLVHLPSNKVPCLHCLVHRKLAIHDFICETISSEFVLPLNPTVFPWTLQPKSLTIKETREAILRHLTALLGNDDVAAHFMLLHLLSRVHARVESVAVGKLSLNLTCFSKENVSLFGNRLGLAIQNLIPFTHSIPLTVDYLNTASLAPRKDYETNRLITGVLQLAEGSHLTVDETQLREGMLNSVGVENARLLKNLMEFQKVEYDFKFYKMEMAADIQVLILSEGKSNILPADLVVPLRPSSASSSEILTEEALESWRWYLATLRSLPHTIVPEMQKIVEDDLVAARQADRSLGSQDFSRWLTMGRLMSISFGETSLSLEHWQMVKELERLRTERLK
ncbi:Mini-chromosome maintenance complex-binding protein [Dillenia turbinata]|uniref:Mini-chromosome maintenance complex-binding protein n=1 Tax=Dillenia turbinata TaxID=194707 RepID=A0AAN8ZCA4_9MAGN